jgi:C4-dicarboxylate-binding protein DctP
MEERSMLKHTLAVCGLALSCLLAPLAAQAKDPIIIRFSHVVAPDTPKGKAAERFRALAAEYTGKQVRVDVYPNSQLYKDKDELEALQLGAVEMLAPSLAKFSPLGVTAFEVFDLPYIFPDKQVLRRVLDGPIGAGLFDQLNPKGIMGLAYWDNGFKIMSANRPLLLPADFEGLKLRIQSSRVLDAQMRALGALPQVMAFSDVYQALQIGVVDGTENPPSNMYTQRMHAVQKYATLSNHGYLGYAVIVNHDFWSGLPDDIRTALNRAMADATAYANDIAQQENDKALAAIRAAGTTELHELSASERSAWIAALKPVHAQMADRVGPDLIAAIYAEAQALGFAF